METNEPELPPMPEPTPQPVPTPAPTPMPAPIPQPEGIVLSPEALTYLRETGKWASFLSVIGFVYCGFILVVAIFIGTFFSFMSRIQPAYGNMPQTAFGFVSVIYILLDVLYFFFPFYLYRFADKIKKGVVFSDSFHITQATENLKSFFKLWGIVTIIVLGLVILIFFFAIIVGLVAH